MKRLAILRAGPSAGRPAGWQAGRRTAGPALELGVTAAALGASALGGARWLRVAQREHYLPGMVTRFAVRWWAGTAGNRALGVAAVAGAGALPVGGAPAGLATAAAVAAGPLGLGLRGRTSKLAWTRRMRTLAGTWAALQVGAVGAGAALGVGPEAAVVAALATPLLVDAACALTAPVERRLARRFVGQATDRLRQIAPTVVAITGSYGKTTTKGYVAHLASTTRQVVPSPASFNNAAGLARAVNEHLTLGTEVFVAEMGTYGPGEIAELCRWVRPDIGVITAIGPVHLERMGSEEGIVAAKSEILEPAKTAVLNVDHPLLVDLAARVAAQGKRLVRCSTTDPDVEVCVRRAASGRDGGTGGTLEVLVSGRSLATVERDDLQPINVACAVAVALELGVPPETIAKALPTLPGAPHRQTVTTGTTGVTIIDDTYNANPAGAAAALQALGRRGGNGRQVVVTPGMVELGRRQHEENARFAAAAAVSATDLIVVGHTNRAALLEGAAKGAARVHMVQTRDEAVTWVRQHLGPGDVVLYENDLPDHFA